jgi:putative SOS response-associated peptidase YedK
MPLIPAAGFYEWMQINRGKQPMRITKWNAEPFAFAGLFDTWTATDGSVGVGVADDPASIAAAGGLLQNAITILRTTP